MNKLFFERNIHYTENILPQKFGCFLKNSALEDFLAFPIQMAPVFKDDIRSLFGGPTKIPIWRHHPPNFRCAVKKVSPLLCQPETAKVPLFSSFFFGWGGVT